MNLNNRITWLEGNLWRETADDVPAGIPDSWLAFDKQGEHVGPPTDAMLAPGQLRVYNALCAMDASVPACPK